MTLLNGWRVSKANADTERAHLNKILAEIQAAVSVGGGAGLLDLGSPADALSSDPLFDFGSPT